MKQKSNDKNKSRKPKISSKINFSIRKPDEEIKEEYPMRLNKYIARSGVMSRRKADEIIKDGQVSVNNIMVLEMGHKVVQEDIVRYNGEVVKPQDDLVYILLNKPKNVITTSNDEHGRLTVMDIVAKACPQRIYPVGRLDRHTTGVLLLTNDGDLAKKLTHPSHNVHKLYHVFLDKPFLQKDFDILEKNGVKLEEGTATVDELSRVNGGGENEVGVKIHMGWNRVVRRMFDAMGYTVVKLDRVVFAGLTKKDVPRGRYRFLREKEVITLKHFLKTKS